MSKKGIITDAMLSLINNEPFYADLIMNMTINITLDIPTAGVNITDTVNLFINPYFYKSLDLEGQKNLLKHECLHVLNNHFSRMKELEPIFGEIENRKNLSNEQLIDLQNKSGTFNQAADYAINQFLKLPETFKMFDKNGNCLKHPEFLIKKDGTKIKNPDFGKEFEAKPLLIDDLIKQNPKLDIQKLQTSEYYYDILNEQQNKSNSKNNNGGNSNGECTFDDHSMWNKTGNIDSQYVKEKIKEVVNKAVERTKERGCGNIPMDLQMIIDNLNYQPKDWRSDLKQFVANSSLTLVEHTKKRRNRRYGIIYPGIKRYPKLNLTVLFDASGSVSNDQAGQFFAELDEIYKKGANITVIEFDAQVNAVYEYSDKKEKKLHGRGGTCFAPAFEKAKELNPDGIIMLTDGCNFDVDAVKQPKCRVLWALLEGCKVSYDWGSKTEIIVKKKVA